MTPSIGNTVTSAPSAVSFYRPTLTRRDLQSVLDALVEEEISTGNQVANFEKELAAAVEVSYAMSFSSYSGAYHMAFLGLDLQRDDEVIIPSSAPLAVLDGLSYIGAKPVVVDLARNSFHPEQQDLLDHITEKTSAILLYYPFGSYSDYRELANQVRSRAKGKDIAIIEDISAMVGIDQDGQHIGNAADVMILGLNNDMPVTIGKGGAVLTDLKKVFQNINNYKLEKTRKQAYKVHYDYGITDYQAAMGLEQLAQQSQNLDRRRKIGRRYLEVCSGVGIETSFQGGLKDSFSSFPIFAPDSVQKAIRHFKSHGIETKSIFEHNGLHNLLQLDSAKFRNTERLSAKAIKLPIYPVLTRVHIERIVNALQKLR